MRLYDEIFFGLGHRAPRRSRFRNFCRNFWCWSRDRAPMRYEKTPVETSLDPSRTNRSSPPNFKQFFFLLFLPRLSFSCASSQRRTTLVTAFAILAAALTHPARLRLRLKHLFLCVPAEINPTTWSAVILITARSWKSDYRGRNRKRTRATIALRAGNQRFSRLVLEINRRINLGYFFFFTYDKRTGVKVVVRLSFVFATPFPDGSIAPESLGLAFNFR